jgi:cation diffusion facilitator CzcD-associated flavoprotein CzcO
MHPSTQAVIGAGAAGLVAARELRKEGHDVVVFEQLDQLGGTWLYTDEVGYVSPRWHPYLDRKVVDTSFEQSGLADAVDCRLLLAVAAAAHFERMTIAVCACCRLRATPWAVSQNARMCTAACTQA